MGNIPGFVEILVVVTQKDNKEAVMDTLMLLMAVMGTSMLMLLLQAVIDTLMLMLLQVVMDTSMLMLLRRTENH